LKTIQRSDGSWGERLEPHSRDYVPHDEGQVVQTAWALLALAEARDPDFDALERGAMFLARSQLGNGQWPRQDPHGLFFRTARLEYTLYRSYFPLWALARFEARRAERSRLEDARTTARKRGLRSAIVIDAPDEEERNRRPNGFPRDSDPAFRSR
jgi:hypothetical protein